jgi:hypothetical protein
MTNIPVEFTITLGWWLVPTVLTVIAFIIAFICDRNQSRHRSNYGILSGTFNGIVGLFLYGLATIFSLIVWLIWALVI